MPEANNDLPEGFKMTEIGPLPEDWEVISFTDCINKKRFKIPQAIPKNEYQDIGKYPVIDQGMNFVAGYTNDENKVLNLKPA